MKISPLAAAGQAIASTDIGRTADPIKLERARAIARGEVPADRTDPQVERTQNSVRTIKMRTNNSTNREEELPEETEAEAPVSSISESIEGETVEVTQPLSPQFAALAKQKRALQVKERELDDREKALAQAPQGSGSEELIAKLKSHPLSVLQEYGVTYDQLTEAILSGQGGISPEIQELRAEIKALKEGVDKTLGDRDTQAEKAALAEMRREADRLAFEGDAFEMIRETKSQPKVTDLIYRTYKESGEVLDVQEAMQLVEDALMEDSLKLAGLKKVQSKFAPLATEPTLQSQPQKQMRTLTARDTANPNMSRRARAIAAMTGTLKR